MRFVVWSLIWVMSLFVGSAWCAAPNSLVGALTDAAADTGQSQFVRSVEHYEYKDSLQRDTPRGTVEGYMAAVYEQDYEKAAEYLDLRYLPEGMSAKRGAEYAKQLQLIIERNLWLDLGQLNDTPLGQDNDQLPAYRDLFGRVALQSDQIALYLQRVPSEGGTIWKVSNATVAKVPKLYENLGYGPVAEWFVNHVPEGRWFNVNLWEWSLVLAYLITAFMVMVPVTWIVKRVILLTKHELKEELAYIVAGPLRFLAAVLLVRAWVSHSSISPAAIEMIDTGFLLVSAIIWFGWSAMGIFHQGLKKRWKEQGKDQAASLLRPLTNFLRVIFVIMAVLLWLEHLGFNASAIIAGMGIGGIAIALASKQSIENFIGTITLYSAAPIKVGNLCKFGSISGTVEEIGLRCTQIRTLDRTLIHVPNAKLVEMEIENISQREKIRFKADIRLDYAVTTSAQLKAIVTEIKEMLEAHELVLKEPLRVTFKGFGLHGLQVNVLAYIGTKSFPTFQLASEELHLKIMDIVVKNGSRIVPVAPVALNNG
ncbi:mechanosensitive ion channel family protein [Shewanella sp. cp20]|uniref:mechanosensitive ion channel family protein n=1 Tax=Shewanella sp. cp20 TaxID=1521167 RepID=UPI0005A23F5E|nr:mechanosensitive ion channel domain-containing protein [Shewanella sp. cp20]KIO35702.1 mechanosensitive ion channel protein MscS [Shewanella sp. cp20]